MQGIVLGAGAPLGTASPQRHLRAGLALLRTSTAGVFGTQTAAPGSQGRGCPGRGQRQHPGVAVAQPEAGSSRSAALSDQFYQCWQAGKEKIEAAGAEPGAEGLQVQVAVPLPTVEEAGIPSVTSRGSADTTP